MDNIIKLREKLSESLKGKLNDTNSEFPYDMHAVSDIESIIKENKEAILELIGIDKAQYDFMSKVAYEKYKKNIDRSQKTAKNMFLLGYQAAIISL